MKNIAETRRDFLKRALVAVIALPVLGQTVVVEEESFFETQLKPRLIIIAEDYRSGSVAYRKKRIKQFNEFICQCEADKYYKAKEYLENFRDALIECYG